MEFSKKNLIVKYMSALDDDFADLHFKREMERAYAAKKSWWNSTGKEATAKFWKHAESIWNVLLAVEENTGSFPWGIVFNAIYFYGLHLRFNVEIPENF